MWRAALATTRGKTRMESFSRVPHSRARRSETAKLQMPSRERRVCLHVQSVKCVPLHRHCRKNTSRSRTPAHSLARSNPGHVFPPAECSGEGTAGVWTRAPRSAHSYCLGPLARISINFRRGMRVCILVRGRISKKCIFVHGEYEFACVHVSRLGDVSYKLCENCYLCI